MGSRLPSPDRGAAGPGGGEDLPKARCQEWPPLHSSLLCGGLCEEPWRPRFTAVFPEAGTGQTASTETAGPPELKQV